MMPAPGLAGATPFRSLLAGLSVVLFSMASSTSAWSIHSSLSNASALYFEENRSFRVYLMPEEILDYIELSGFDCSIVDDQAYIKTITKLNGTRGTRLQWNNKAPPERKEFTLQMNCDQLSVLNDTDADATPTSIMPSRISRRVVRDVSETVPTQLPTGPDPKAEKEATTEPAPTTERTTVSPGTTASSTSTVASTALPSKAALEAVTVTLRSVVESPAKMPVTPGESTTTTSESAPIEITSQPSSGPEISAPRTTATSSPSAMTTTTTTTDSPRVPPGEAPVSTTSSSSENSGIKTESTGNDSVAGREPSDNGESTSTSDPGESTSTSKPGESQRGFSLVIMRISMDFVHGQKLSSLDDALNITRELEAGMFHTATLTKTVLEDSTSSPEEEKPRCLVLPKEVRVVEGQYVLFSVGLNATSGELIRGGHMQGSCGYGDWRPGKEFLAEAAHVRFLDAKLFQLQVLSICLAAAVIVFALSAVFLCTRWRLPKRGSRREANHEFFIKTFNTKEHQYAANGDDFYGFPTIKRDSTFHRDPSYVNATPKSIDGSSFVNGAFQDGEDHQNLPAPPPELRTCIINDANFTEVPLHNLGSDSLRAHRGAHRHQSPPPPPLRTVSSGYMSGQSTPAAEYHNPHEVMILPPIPKEDYSDSDSESGHTSLKTPEGNAGRAVERKGRFTVRTAL